MRARRVLAAVVAVAAVAGALAWANRLWLMQYSLGWYTDLVHPRDGNRPVPWEDGPAAAEQPPAQRPPNIVLILADDLGINDVTTYGGGHGALGVPTPAIDSLAAEGVRFDRGYAGSAVCTPSRAALLTGRYPWRFGLEFTPTPGAMARVAPLLYADRSRPHPIVIDTELAARARPFHELGMPGSERTLAEVLRARGYHTVHVGKWHLGSTGDMLPNAQGFDESLTMESGLYLPEGDPRGADSKQPFDPIDRFLWPNMRWAVSYNGGRWFEPAGYLTDYFTDEAVSVIRRNRNRPFFLYLAHWGVHTPLQASRDDYDALADVTDHRRRVYLAMIRALDRSVRRVLDALREEGLDDNTLVIFSSDNGAPNYIGLPEVNRPYRGWKLTLYEGGLRVPTVARWPARIAAGSRVEAPVSHIDVLPTVAAAVGAPLTGDRPIDGIDLLSHVGRDASPVPQRPLFWRTGAYRAVGDGRWKLIVSARPKRERLFDLQADPTERTDLAAREPATVARLRALLDAHHAAMPPSLWPSFLEMPVAIDKTLDQPQTADDDVDYWIN